MASSAAPTHRHRSKSAPRGRSPNPKQLKKVAKGMVTPPPKPSKVDPSQSGSEKKPKEKKINRKLSFGPNSTTEIRAENPPGNSPYGGMKLSKATEIVEALKKEILGWETMGFKFDSVHWHFQNHSDNKSKQRICDLYIYCSYNQCLSTMNCI